MGPWPRRWTAWTRHARSGWQSWWPRLGRGPPRRRRRQGHHAQPPRHPSRLQLPAPLQAMRHKRGGDPPPAAPPPGPPARLRQAAAPVAGWPCLTMLTWTTAAGPAPRRLARWWTRRWAAAWWVASAAPTGRSGCRACLTCWQLWAPRATRRRQGSRRRCCGSWATRLGGGTAICRWCSAASRWWPCWQPRHVGSPGGTRSSS